MCRRRGRRHGPGIPAGLRRVPPPASSARTLNITAIEAGVPALVAGSGDTEQASDDAAHAIMTTDTVKIRRSP